MTVRLQTPLLARSLGLALAAASTQPAGSMDKPPATPASGSPGGPALQGAGPGQAPASAADASKRARLLDLIATLERQVARDQAAIAGARRDLAQAGGPDATAQAQAALDQAQKKLAADGHLLKEARARRDALASPAAGAPAAGSAAESKGDRKTSGEPGPATHPAATARPARHPFFHPSPRHGPGTVIRFRLWASDRKDQAPGKVVRCTNGHLYWIEREFGAVGGLQPGRAPALLLLEPPGEAGLTRDILDLQASGTDLWTLSGRPGGNLRVRCATAEAKVSGFQVRIPLDQPPIGFLPNRTGTAGCPKIAAPDQLVVTGLGGREPQFKRIPILGERPLGPATRFHGNQGNSVMYFHDPGRNAFGRLVPDRSAGGFQVQDLCGPDKIAIGDIVVVSSLAGRQPVDTIFATYPATDAIASYQVGTGRIQQFRLVPGTAPGAMVPGPGGSLLFTTAGGFGCLAPDGKVTRIPVLGGRVDPVALVPGGDSGRLYFTEAGRPFICALVLADPGADGKAPAVPPGPSLLAADHPEPGRPAPAWRRKRRAKGAAAAAGQPPAGAAAAESKEDAGAGPEAEPAEPEPASEEEAGAVVPLEEEGPEAERVREHVRFRQVAEAFGHICKGHLHSEAEPDGSAKSQFSKALSESRRRLSTLLVRGANDPGTLVYYQYEDDKEAKDGQVEVTVFEFTADGTVGRVRQPGAAGGWTDTRRVRVVQKTRPKTGETYVSSAYPIP